MIRIRQADGSSIALPGLAPSRCKRAATPLASSATASTAARHDASATATKATSPPIGRASAVADIGRIRLSGFPAWITWLTVHLWYLIGFENRLLVLTRWAFSFIAHGRGARLITGQPDASTTASVRPALPMPANPTHPGRRQREAV